MDNDDTTLFNGLEINVAAVIIAQLLSEGLTDDEMSLLASFLYTVSDCLNTLVLAQDQ